VPGPKALPIIGNALDLPEYPEKQYMKWAKEYGELFQVQLGWNNWVFVCSEQAVKVLTSSTVAFSFSRNLCSSCHNVEIIFLRTIPPKPDSGHSGADTRKSSTNNPQKLPPDHLSPWHKTSFPVADVFSSWSTVKNGVVSEQ
jgi:hypothetical protein